MDKRTTVPAIAFRSIGCRTNQEEMVTLSGTIVKMGYRIVDEVADADIIMVNTCSVTEATESKTRRFINTLAREAPQARILVTGCLAQQHPLLLSTMKNVAWVVGNQHKHAIGTIISQEPEGIYSSSFTDDYTEPLLLQKDILFPGDPRSLRTRFPLKIQEGCNHHCTYCIVPTLRGPSRSGIMSEILVLAKEAVDAGYKELVLTGTHIGQFADGISSSLVELVSQLSAIEGDFRIRLSSLDPRDCSQELLDLLGGNKKVCNHLHVSLQSCSPVVLDAMHRPSDRLGEIMERLVNFRHAHPDAGMGADIIVGFPGESEAMYLETWRGIDTLQLSYVHVFKYSRRPGTPAAAMENQVVSSVKEERSARLRKCVTESRCRFVSMLVDKPQRIIIESSNPLRGLTSNFLHVEIPDLHAERNSWLNVYITENVQGRFCIAHPATGKVV